MKKTKIKKFVTKEDITKLRLRKIKQYLLKSLHDPDPLQANLGMATSDLMGIALQLKQAIDEELSDESERSRRIERILPPLEMYLKINRQIDRNVRIMPSQIEGPTEKMEVPTGS